nr:hypothetical protein [Tanacetum cinerariifolium]
MAAGSRDRPLMLAIGRYPQWRSRFLRYIDTRPNGEALRKCILSGPYKPTTVLVQAVDATDNSPAIPEHMTVEKPMNMSPENKAHFEAKKEAIHLILTGIGDEIYSTVDACQTAQEMWEAIKMLQQGESLNIQDAKTNLFWEFEKFTLHDGETMESYYTRFYKLMNEMIRNNLTVTTMQVNVQFLQQLQLEWSRFVTIFKQQHKLDEVSYHKLFDILKQYQNKVNELRAERLASNANPLALVATAQANQDAYYQTSRHKGKEIAKLITPPSETASEEDNDPEQAQRDKDMQNNLALIAKNKNVDTTLRFKNDNQSGQFGNQRTVNVAKARENECRKPKRVKDSAYHKEKMLICKQDEQGVPLQTEKYDWLANTDEEVDEQELEAHYSYMEKIQKVPTADSGIDSEPLKQVQNDARYNVFANELQHSEQSESVSNTCLVETDDSNVIPASPDMCEDAIQNDQNDVKSDDERVALANLKLNVDENKKIQKQLKKANTTLAQELKECKAIFTETRQLALKDIEIKEGLKTKAYELSVVKEKHDELVKQSLLTKSHYEGLVKQKTKNDSFRFVHDLKQKMHADLKYVESLEKEIDKLESDKDEFSNMYDVILQECVSKDVMCSYLTSVSDLDALDELQCLYLHKVKECDCLAQKLSKQTESVSEEVYNELLKHFAKVENIRFLLKLLCKNTLPQTARQAVSNTNVLKPGMYRIDNRSTQTRAPQLPQTVRNTNPRVTTSTGVNHNTNVSRPQHKSNESRDKVMPYNSQVKVKKTKVEV